MAVGSERYIRKGQENMIHLKWGSEYIGVCIYKTKFLLTFTFKLNVCTGVCLVGVSFFKQYAVKIGELFFKSSFC